MMNISSIVTSVDCGVRVGRGGGGMERRDDWKRVVQRV